MGGRRIRMRAWKRRTIRVTGRQGTVACALTVAASAAGTTTVLPEGLRAQQPVRIPAEPTASEAATTELYRVGTLDGPDHEAFGEVVAVAFGPDGSLHVMDRGGFRVVVFGPDGTFLRQLGRQGAGPGEFQLPAGLGVDGQQRVWAGDIMTRRLSVFDDTGEVVEIVPMGGVGRPDLGTLTVSVDGTAFLLDRTMAAQNDSIPLFRVAVGDGVQTVARLPIAFTPRTEQTSGTTFRMVAPPTFSPVTRVVALADGGWAATHGAGYQITVHSPAGPVFTASASVEPAPVTEAHREGHKERLRGRNRDVAENPPPAYGGFAMRAMDEDRLEAMLADMRFAEVHPVIQGLTADPEGRLWIQRWGGDPWGPGPIDLIAADGRYLGTLSSRVMPDAVGPGGLVAYVEEDGMGVPRVRVGRVDLPG